jgi:hypothetical protein
VQRITLALVALLAVAGCSSAPVPTPSPSTTVSVPAEAPADGVLLSDLGFVNSPPGFSIPRGADIEQEVDSANNVTVVLTAPAGEEVADYLRRNLPAMGFTITADANGSLLFESAVHDGAFTVTGELAALSLRTDRAP